MPLNTTRVDVGPDRHIVVDWRLKSFDLAAGQWRATGQARLWETTLLRSGIEVSIRPLTEPVELETSGETMEAAARALIVAAHERLTQP